MGYVHSLVASSTVCVHLLPELATGYSNHNRRFCSSSSLTFCPRNNNRHVSVTLATQSDLAPPYIKPQIELQFIGPKPDADGNYPLDRVIALSGDKLLRSIMQDSKIELYAPYGKVMNCGGGGTCGTCIVEIIDGKDLLNERTNTELRYLKKKPESWRLACQTIVGDKENSGKVVVQRLPQWKK